MVSVEVANERMNAMAERLETLSRELSASKNNEFHADAKFAAMVRCDSRPYAVVTMAVLKDYMVGREDIECMSRSLTPEEFEESATRWKEYFLRMAQHFARQL